MTPYRYWCASSLSSLVLLSVFVSDLLLATDSVGDQRKLSLSPTPTPSACNGPTIPLPEGRWIPDSQLGVIHILQLTPTTPGSNTSDGAGGLQTFLFTSYMSTSENRWHEAKATYDPRCGTVNISAIRLYKYRHNISTDKYATGNDWTWFPTCFTGDLSNSSFYPQIRWNGPCKDEKKNNRSWTMKSAEVLSAFQSDAVWHLYGTDLVCRQDHPFGVDRQNAKGTPPTTPQAHHHDKKKEKKKRGKEEPRAGGYQEEGENWEEEVLQSEFSSAEVRDHENIPSTAGDSRRHRAQLDAEPTRRGEKLLKRIHGANNITKVHVVFTQHFDLGYTDYAYCVLDHYLWYILPGVALTAGELSNYKYTTHPFILYTLFNCEALLPAMRPPPGLTFYCPSKEVRTLVETAVLAKQIVWHAFPFDGYNEMLGSTLYDYSFNYAQWLAEKFFPANASSSIPTAMQQIDVPGLYRVQVARMKKGGNVRGIYVGQNSQPIWAGALVTMPTLFQWYPIGSSNPNQTTSSSSDVQQQEHQQDETDEDPILVMVHQLGYGGISLDDAVIDEASGTALVVMCSLENRPSYTPQDIEGFYKRLHGEFPNAEVIKASTYDEFIDDVRSLGWPRSDLPSYHEDIGDSWVRSASGDPLKVKKMQHYRRNFENCVSNREKYCNGTTDEDLMAAAYFLISGCEHNWGLSMDPNDWESVVLSYEEKRQMVESATHFVPMLVKENGEGAGRAKQQEEETRVFGGGVKRNTGPALSERGSTDRPVGATAESRTFQCAFSKFDEVTVRISEDGSIEYFTHHYTFKNEGYMNVTAASPVGNHHLARILYAVHNTESPTWGDPNPNKVMLEAHPTLVPGANITFSQDPSTLACTVTVHTKLNQSFFNTNSGKYVHGKSVLGSETGSDDGQWKVSNLTLFFESTYTITRQSVSSVNLQVDVALINLALSDTNAIYHGYYNIADIGNSLFVQFNPTITQCFFPASYRRPDDDRSVQKERRKSAEEGQAQRQYGPPCQGEELQGTWSLDALGQTYDPYSFHVNGTCQYHIVDSAMYSVTQSTGATMVYSAQVSSPDVQLVMFGWNNGQWQSQATPGPHPRHCAPNTTAGVWYNIYNSWNGNWCVGFPWNREDGLTEPLSFRFDFTLNAPD